MESQNMMAIVDTFAMLAQGVHGHKDALRILGFCTYCFAIGADAAQVCST